MLTLSNLRDTVTATLSHAPSTDFPPFPAQLSTTTADSVRDNWINGAGRHLYSMHQWGFTAPDAIKRDYVAGQDYIVLPDDFGSLIDLTATDGTNDSVSIIELSRLTQLRNTPIEITGTGRRYAAISWPRLPDPVGEMPNPRLELWPSITSDSAGAVTILYRARWMDLKNSTDVAATQWHVENLLTILVAAFARGWGEEDAADLDDRLGKIGRGEVYKAAKEQDGMIQPSLGRMSGGAIGISDPTNPWVLRASGAVTYQG